MNNELEKLKYRIEVLTFSSSLLHLKKLNRDFMPTVPFQQFYQKIACIIFTDLIKPDECIYPYFTKDNKEVYVHLITSVGNQVVLIYKKVVYDDENVFVLTGIRTKYGKRFMGGDTKFEKGEQELQPMYDGLTVLPNIFMGIGDDFWFIVDASISVLPEGKEYDEYEYNPTKSICEPLSRKELKKYAKRIMMKKEEL